MNSIKITVADLLRSVYRMMNDAVQEVVVTFEDDNIQFIEEQPKLSVAYGPIYSSTSQKSRSTYSVKPDEVSPLLLNFEELTVVHNALLNTRAMLSDEMETVSPANADRSEISTLLENMNDLYSKVDDFLLSAGVLEQHD